MEDSDADIMGSVLAQLEAEAESQPPQPPVPEDDGDAAWSAAAESARWTLPGLAPMTRVTTTFGEVFAHALRKRDMVRMPNGDYQPIEWLDRVTLDAQLLVALPDAQSVLIMAGGLGKGLPTHDVRVSPEQLLLPSPKAPLSEARTARSLLGRSGVTRHHETAITYTRFRLAKPSPIRCEGLCLVTG